MALITGAVSGIGLATARQLIAEGATVVGTDINQDELNRSQICGSHLIPCCSDAGDITQIEPLMTMIEKSYTAAASARILDTVPKIVPAGRMGTVQDIAQVIYFLASNEATFINGAHMLVDGGLSRVSPTGLASRAAPLPLIVCCATTAKR